jgi:hypothetical protein
MGGEGVEREGEGRGLKHTNEIHQTLYKMGEGVWGEWEFNAEEMNLYIQSTLYTCMELPQ